MDQEVLDQLLADVAAGRVPADEAAARLSRLPMADLGFARVDHHRALRQGLPEAIYAPGKSVDHCVAIVGELLGHGTGPVVLTRADEAQAAAVVAAHPGSTAVGRTLTWRQADPVDAEIVVVTAGTADLPVADECVAVLSAYGVGAKLLADCGVAGIHRILGEVDSLTSADAVVVVAGMEGALASVVAGLVACPVIAVPTSVGYGSGLDGITALLAMTAACAPGITVVGIDNGYGAACAVARLLQARRA
jgi:NCAIR mutase (PurE)-related protein